MKYAKTPNYALIERVGKMYYILQMNQQSIADKLGISRTSVVRLLSEGRDLGIIQIYIKGQNDDLRNRELESDLLKKYKMKDIVVARNIGPNSYYNMAAKYIEGILPKSGNICLSGGITTHTIANYLYPAETNTDLNIVQLTGLFSEKIPNLSVVQRWSEKLNANPMYLSAPGIVNTPQKRDMFLNDFNIINTYKAMCNADIAIVGIGTPSTILKNINTLDFPQEMFKDLETSSVGDVMFHFYNEMGAFCAEEISNHVVGATIVDFLRIQTRIAVAFGDEKVKAIAGGMKGGVVNIMITDENTAKKILQI